MEYNAMVMARLLTAKGFDCTVSFLCGESLFPLATLNRERLPKQVKQTVSLQQAIDACESAELLVDGVFGIGFHGALPAEVTAVFETANRLNAHRAALCVYGQKRKADGKTICLFKQKSA